MRYLDICDRNHERIVYSTSCCPMCELLNELDEKDSSLKKMKEANDELEVGLDDAQDEIKTLRNEIEILREEVVNMTLLGFGGHA